MGGNRNRSRNKLTTQILNIKYQKKSSPHLKDNHILVVPAEKLLQQHQRLLHPLRDHHQGEDRVQLVNVPRDGRLVGKVSRLEAQVKHHLIDADATCQATLSNSLRNDEGGIVEAGKVKLPALLQLVVVKHGLKEGDGLANDGEEEGARNEGSHLRVLKSAVVSEDGVVEGGRDQVAAEGGRMTEVVALGGQDKEGIVEEAVAHEEVLDR